MQILGTVLFLVTIVGRVVKSAPIAAAQNVPQVVMSGAVECQRYPSGCIHDIRNVWNAQQPLRATSKEVNVVHRVLGVHPRQLLPSSGDDFWSGGSG